jgi:hypothetical protein
MTTVFSLLFASIFFAAIYDAILERRAHWRPLAASIACLLLTGLAGYGFLSEDYLPDTDWPFCLGALIIAGLAVSAVGTVISLLNLATDGGSADLPDTFRTASGIMIVAMFFGCLIAAGISPSIS